ncbi:leucine-rich repeat domain-containing protein [Sporocytophaga myxococcoides]|uniref:leucine-rich repeat domain-containing protein n=1 Tax=Sporocytophaga myxococcoides TaxID=153721 RepID=UPI000490B3C3|nr:leucine-rich repeat domain-containing protein [Sporocytophaga myxococcoides]
MKKILFALLLTTISLKMNAQTDILLPMNDIEKKEVIRLLTSYDGFLNFVAQKPSEADQKKESVTFLKTTVSNANISVYNDLDSAAKNDDYENVFKYCQRVPKTFPATVKIKTTPKNLIVEKVKYDKIRRYYFVEIKGDKDFTWKEVVQKAASDSVSTSVDSIAVSDTIVHSIKKGISVFIKFDRENNVSKNFKIFAISKTGVAPKLEPLPPLISWWLTLEPDWKAMLRKKRNLEEYPREFDLEKATGIFEFDCSNSNLKNLEPLKKFTSLEKLNVSGNPITDASAIFAVSSLLELDLTRTQITSLDGIENLKNLQVLKVSSLKLKSIEPLKNLVQMVELDCSNNEIEDLTPLTNLVNLKELNVGLNIKVKDISMMKNLVLLEKLSIQKIDIKSLAPLSGLVNLVLLDCFNTDITTLEPIRNLVKLFHLNIDHTMVSSLDPIKHFKFIANLYLASSSVKDLSAINNFYAIRELDISNTELTDLGPIHKLEYIRVLKCFYTKIDKNEVQRFKKNHPGCQITYY